MSSSSRPPGAPKPSRFPRLGGGAPGGGSSLRPWLFPLVLVLAMLGAMTFGEARKAALLTLPYTAFVAEVEAGNVKKVALSGLEVRGELARPKDHRGRPTSEFQTTLPVITDDRLLPLLETKKVEVEAHSDEPSLAVYTLLNFALPFLLVIGLLYWMGKRSSSMMGGPLSGLTKGKAKRFDRELQVGVQFKDVAGNTAVKRDLEEIVQFLKFPEKFRKLGGRIPRGVLLVGPPGTGKTLLARAVAGEAGVPFFSINGSEFIELFVGVGASRVRELFEEAKKVAPAIIFIDEIDAVGRARGAGLGGGHDEREQTLNQLLGEMDGFTRNDLTIVIAATNRPDVLDPALLRPGRFDRRVVIDRPEVGARRAILEVHTRGKPLGADVSLDDWARDTPGFSGADLANLCNEAALAATRRGVERLEHIDFRTAYDKIVLGDVRDSKLSPEEKRRVAIHEAGHAVVAHFSEGSDPLERVTIIPRGMALGVTQQAAPVERYMMTRPEFVSRLRVLMGGYAAERVILGNSSSGAENDLKRASEIAFRMVAHFGMSEAIGPVFYEHRTEHPFLGQRMGTDGGTSEQTIFMIEEEARKLLTAAREEAETLLTRQKPRLVALYERLLDVETLEKSALLELLGEKEVREA